MPGQAVDGTEWAAPPLPMPARPKQFALVLDPEDAEYAEYVRDCKPSDPVVWWGCDISGRILLYQIDKGGRPHIARYNSVRRAVDLWERVCPIKLVWL
jgi:hypothetical protein